MTNVKISIHISDGGGVKTFRDVHHHPHHLPPRPALSALGALRHPLPDPTTTTAFEGQGMSWVNVTTDFK